jgi:hypothetical protein
VRLSADGRQRFWRRPGGLPDREHHVDRARTNATAAVVTPLS